MNQLKPISDNEVTALKHAIVETYVGYIISAQHGIVHIGTVKNQISGLQKKIADLQSKPYPEFMAQTIHDLIVGDQEKLNAQTKLLEDIYVEVNMSDDPRSMLNLKTLEIHLTATRALHETLSNKHKNETSVDLATTISESVNVLGKQMINVQLMINLMKD